MLKTNCPSKVPIIVSIGVGVVLGWIVGFIAKLPTGWSLLLGGGLGWIIGGYVQHLREVCMERELDSAQPERESFDPNGFSATLKLCEEQLDIIKKMVSTGKVDVHTEMVTEEKNITVPVNREELVIETTALDSETSRPEAPVTETIRIPLREERVEVSKHFVDLEKVNVEQRQFQTTETVTGTVKKEQLRVETAGEARVSAADSESSPVE